MRRRFFVFLWLGVAPVWACGPLGSEPATGYWQDNPPEAVGTTETARKPASPSLDPGLPIRQCERDLAITGTAEPGTTVYATGNGGNATAEVDPADGSFCIAVRLAEGLTNQITLRIMNSEGQVSDPVMVSVLHESCTGSSGDVQTVEVPSKNIALGGTVQAKDQPTEGNLTQLVDGNTGSWTRWVGKSWCWDCEYEGWVSIALTEMAAVDKISVHWRDMLGAGYEYARKYRVLISNLESPGEPSLTNGFWQEIATIDDGNGGLDIHYLDGHLIRHVALKLEMDDRPWLAGWPQENFDEYFTIAEIEVWTQASKATAQPDGPVGGVCGSN